jgi:hypothetical protein
MATVLFAMGIVVVLGFATYLRLPLTSVYIVTLASLAFSMTPRREPLDSVLDLFSTPARVVEAYGDGLGLTPLATAVLCIGLTFVVDVVVTSALGCRRK